MRTTTHEFALSYTQDERNALFSQATAEDVDEGGPIRHAERCNQCLEPCLDASGHES